VPAQADIAATGTPAAPGSETSQGARAVPIPAVEPALIAIRPRPASAPLAAGPAAARNAAAPAAAPDPGLAPVVPAAPAPVPAPRDAGTSGGDDRGESAPRGGTRASIHEAPPELAAVGSPHLEAARAEGRAAPSAPAAQAPHGAAPVAPGAEPPLAEQVVRAARLVAVGERTQVDVELSPPELGAIRVRASSERGGGAASLTITAERPETRDLLLAALPALRQALAGHGVAAPSITVAAAAEPAPDSRRDPLRRDGRARERAEDRPSWTRARRSWAPVSALDFTV
jgi:hypothetical protein